MIDLRPYENTIGIRSSHIFRSTSKTLKEYSNVAVESTMKQSQTRSHINTTKIFARNFEVMLAHTISS